LREERRLRVFENRLLSRIFGPRRDEVRGEDVKRHNVGVHDLYCTTNIGSKLKTGRIKNGHGM
jgi:hypothetical protein